MDGVQDKAVLLAYLSHTLPNPGAHEKTICIASDLNTVFLCRM